MPFVEIKGDKVPIKLWTQLEGVESQALGQLKSIAALPWVAHHVAAMPDVHFGIGATVGSVIAMNGACAPAAVGVDIGCVDKDTEYLAPDGWHKISEYTGGKVMQQGLTGLASFQHPIAFIKLPCDEFIRIKTKYGVDQKLSADHRTLFAKYDRNYAFDKLDVILASDLATIHNSTASGFRGRFLTTFSPELDTSVPFTDDELRLIIMAAADGSFDNASTLRCRLHLKKPRKIDRAICLLGFADVGFDVKENSDGTTSIYYDAPINMKSLAGLWAASLQQLKIIVDEIFNWDGNKEESCFYTRDKPSADFMSYAFAACGFRSVMRQDEHYRDGELDYRVFAHNNTIVGINGTPKTPLTKEVSEDGFKYCFTVPGGFWIMRRGGVIAVTGNCGMAALKTNLRASSLPSDLGPLRASIEASIPVGFSRHDKAAYNQLPKYGEFQTVRNDCVDLMSKYTTLAPAVREVEGTAMTQLGSLGGGNHFIELCLDSGVCTACDGFGYDAGWHGDDPVICDPCRGQGKTDPFVWIMLHSGSRNVGKTLAEFHMAVAKKLDHNRDLADKALSVFLAGTTEMNAYRRDLYWAQDYAMLNRRVMLSLYKLVLLKHFPQIQFTEQVVCHHNYLAEEVHFGQDLFVTRKGAIRAGVGEMGIIPGSMGTKSFIVEGLGNPESFCSASHGAGRRMSRGAAKKQFTVDDLKAQTFGIECRKDEGVVDEIPACYKKIEDVMENQKDLVKIKYELKQLLCVKG